MPRRTLVIIGSIVLAGLLVVGAAAAFVLRTPAASSGEFTAIPVVQNTQAPAATEAGATEAPAVAEGVVVFEISQDESEARFIINEVLNGSDKTVVGVTNQIAGQILVDAENTANVQLGQIQVNTRTLSTDSGNRNRAIQNIILETGRFEFVTFTPTAISGLPASAAAGDTFTFQVTGDLTIRDVTQQVTFEVSVTAESDQRIVGLGRTTINRGDFGLEIPQVPQVASVEENLILELEFVALAQA
jgi:polyisoprenoid-binding protein YceI